MTTGISKPFARPQLDRLEERTVPTVTLDTGNLIIEGTPENDVVILIRRGDNFIVRDNGEVSKFSTSKVTGNVQFTGLEGNDGFWNFTRLASIVDAGAGNDRVYGGYGADLINGGDGDDYLSAGFDRFTNVVIGGLGADRILGSLGDDVLIGGTGDEQESDTDTNWIFGLFGNDSMVGGAGTDYLSGGFGNDTLEGGDGNDRLYGGLGLDSLFGQGGDDYLNGGDDNAVDVLEGGEGADRFVEKFYWRFLPNLNRDNFVDFTEGEDTKVRF